jgi:hypothetical protein
MSRYPDGTSSGDPRAPWNQPPAPECRDCEETITRASDHEPSCSNEGMGPSELYTQREEDARIERAERRMEEQRLQEALDN